MRRDVTDGAAGFPPPLWGRDREGGRGRFSARGLISTSLSCAFLFAAPAHADEVADFYKSKFVTLTVSTSAGSGNDILARTIARFLGRHLPSTPNVIVR